MRYAIPAILMMVSMPMWAQQTTDNRPDALRGIEDASFMLGYVEQKKGLPLKDARDRFHKMHHHLSDKSVRILEDGCFDVGYGKAKDGAALDTALTWFHQQMNKFAGLD